MAVRVMVRVHFFNNYGKMPHKRWRSPAEHVIFFRRREGGVGSGGAYIHTYIHTYICICIYIDSKKPNKVFHSIYHYTNYALLLTLYIQE